MAEEEQVMGAPAITMPAVLEQAAASAPDVAKMLADLKGEMERKMEQMKRDFEAHLQGMAQAVFQAMADAQVAGGGGAKQDGGVVAAASLVNKVGESVVGDEPAPEFPPAKLTHVNEAVFAGELLGGLESDLGRPTMAIAAVKILGGGVRLNIGGSQHAMPGRWLEIGGGEYTYTVIRLLSQSRMIQAYVDGTGWTNVGLLVPTPSEADLGAIGEFHLQWNPGSGSVIGKWELVKQP